MTARTTGTTARRAAAAALACACLGAALASCAEEDPDAGTNGLGKLSAAKIQKQTLSAAKAAESVRLSGDVVTAGQTYKLAMRLNEEGGQGQVTSKNSTFELLRVGKALYLKADSDFWNHEDGGGNSGTEADAAAAGKLDDKYVKVPTTDPAYKQLSVFTDMDTLLDGLLTLHGTTGKGARASVNGTPTIDISGDKGAGGALSVSLHGKPYPLQLKRGGGAGTLKLSEWGKGVDLETPAENEVLDYGQQLPTSS